MGVFGGWLRTSGAGFATDAAASIHSTAAGGRGCDADPIVDQAYQRAREGLFQPRPALMIRFRHGPVQDRQQSLDLAKFRRAFMTEPIDGAQQQPQPDLLRHRGKDPCIENAGIHAAACR